MNDEEKSPIPLSLRRSDGLPFEHCSLCERKLSDDLAPYLVEKAIRRYPGLDKVDVIFEYAMCLSCVETAQSEISNESRLRLQEWMTSALLAASASGRLPEDPAGWEDSLSKCIVSGKSVSEPGVYQLIGLCQGDNLSTDMTPMMFSEEVLDTMQELLSEETRRGLDKLRDKLLVPPSDLEPWFTKPRFILF